jgi:hypothetical protein
VIKLIDYQGKEAELDASSNPFSDVILAQLAAINLNGKHDEQKKKVKFSLTKRLYEKGYTKEKVLNLYTFIDWLIGLPKLLEVQYLNDIYALEEATKMAYITSAERFGMEKGIQQEKIIIAEKLLAEKVDLEFIAKITQLSLQEIRKLQDKLN